MSTVTTPIVSLLAGGSAKESLISPALPPRQSVFKILSGAFVENETLIVKLCRQLEIQDDFLTCCKAAIAGGANNLQSC